MGSSIGGTQPGGLGHAPEPPRTPVSPDEEGDSDTRTDPGQPVENDKYRAHRRGEDFLEKDLGRQEGRRN